ncbi:hypothetical protein KA405_04755 [Patescibacteria group bacterium]|nr:hypothetical protein [Patescibacteria group bacterium]
MDYIGILKFKDDFKTFLNIMKNKRIRNYVMRNYLYLLPFIGKSLFAQDNTKIIPLLKSSDLEASPIR